MANPLREMTTEAVFAEWQQWNDKIKNATGWGAALAAANGFRENCLGELRRRGFHVVDEQLVPAETKIGAVAGAREELVLAVHLTEAEIAKEREHALARLPWRYSDESPEEWAARWNNSVAYREPLHSAHIIANMVVMYLMEHPNVIFDAEAHRLAMIAHATLFELYQRIGHLDPESENAGHAP